MIKRNKQGKHRTYRDQTTEHKMPVKGDIDRRERTETARSAPILPDSKPNYALDVFNAILSQQVKAAAASCKKRAERTEGKEMRLRGVSEKTGTSLHHSPDKVETHDAVNHLSRSEQMHDAVNHPSHYCQGGIECIDAIQSAVNGLDGPAAWLTGSIIKYVWRWSRKNGAEDLRKARFYLDRLIRVVEDREAAKYAEHHIKQEGDV